MDLNLNLSEKEGQEYGYAMFKTLPEININRNKCTPVAPVTSVDITDDNNVIVAYAECTDIHLLLSTAKFIEIQKVTFIAEIQKSW